MAEAEAGIRIKVGGGPEAVSQLRNVKQAGAEMLDGITAAGERVPTSLSAISAAIEELQDAFRGAGPDLSRFQSILGTLGTGGLIAGGIVTGLATIGAGLTLVTRRTAEQIVTLEDQARALGITIERYQELDLAAQRTSRSQEQVSSALNAFQTRLAQAQTTGGGFTKQLDAIDESLKTTVVTAGSTAQAFDLAVAAVLKIPDPAKQAAAAIALFGENGAKLIPTFRELAAASATLREQGLFDREDAERARALTQAFDDLSRIVSTNLSKAFIDLAPVITGAARLITGFVAGAAATVRDLSNAVNALVGNLDAAAAQEQRIDDLRKKAAAARTPESRASLEAAASQEERKKKEIDDFVAGVQQSIDQMVAAPSTRQLPPNEDEVKERKRRLDEIVRDTKSAADASLTELQRFDAKWKETVDKLNALRAEPGIDVKEIDKQLAEVDRVFGARREQLRQKEADEFQKDLDKKRDAQIAADAKTYDEKAARVKEVLDYNRKLEEEAQRKRDADTKKADDERKRAAERAAAEAMRPYERAFEGIVEVGTSALAELFQNGTLSAESAAGAIKNIFLDLFVDLAKQQVIEPLLDQLKKAGAGGTGTSGGGGLLGGLLGIFGGGKEGGQGGTGGLGSLVGTVTTLAAVAFSLYQGVKSVTDSANELQDAALGTANAQANLLRGIGTVGVVAGVGGGAALGAAAGSAFPGIGTAVGAAVGAAIGGALAATIPKAIASGIGEGIAQARKQGLTQEQLQRAVEANPTIAAMRMTGVFGAPIPALSSTILSLFVPDIERIFDKLARQTLGLAGLSTATADTGALTRRQTEALQGVRGDLRDLSQYLSMMIGAGTGDADRIGRFLNLVGEGLLQEARRTGKSVEGLLFKTFRGLFGGEFTQAFVAGRNAELSRRLPIRAFGEAFPQINVARIAEIFDTAVKGSFGAKNLRAAREAIQQALAAAFAAPPTEALAAFRTKLTESVAGSFFDGIIKAAAKAPGFDILAESFTVSRRTRRALAREGFTPETVAQVVKEIDKAAADFGAVLEAGGGAFIESLTATFNLGLRMAIQFQIAAGDFEGAVQTVLGQLQPILTRIAAIDQVAADIARRSASALGESGSTQGAQAALELLRAERQRIEREFARRIGAGGIRAAGAATGAGEEQLALDLAAARMNELEAQLALQRQMRDELQTQLDTLRDLTQTFADFRAQIADALGQVDQAADAQAKVARAVASFEPAAAGQFADTRAVQQFQRDFTAALSAVTRSLDTWRAAAEGFGDIAQSARLQRGGRPAARAELFDIQAQLEAARRQVLAGGPGAAEAAARAQQLAQQVLQLGGDVYQGRRLRNLLAWVEGISEDLAREAAARVDVAEQQLEALDKIAAAAEASAQAERDRLIPTLEGIEDGITETEAVLRQFATDAAAGLNDLRNRVIGELNDALNRMAAALGTSGPIYAVLTEVRDRLPQARRAEGGPVTRGVPYWVGERGPEIFSPQGNGMIVPFYRTPVTPTLHLSIPVTVTPATGTEAEARTFGRTVGNAAAAEVVAVLDRLGIARRRVVA